jgi:hypothetical protein
MDFWESDSVSHNCSHQFTISSKISTTTSSRTFCTWILPQHLTRLTMHQILLQKLKCYSVTGWILEWFTDYRNGRTQRAVVDGPVLQWSTYTSGVPQGRFWVPYYLLSASTIFLKLFGMELIQLSTRITQNYTEASHPWVTANIYNKSSKAWTSVASKAIRNLMPKNVKFSQ